MSVIRKIVVNQGRSKPVLRLLDLKTTEGSVKNLSSLVYSRTTLLLKSVLHYFNDSFKAFYFNYKSRSDVIALLLRMTSVHSGCSDQKVFCTSMVETSTFLLHICPHFS